MTRSALDLALVGYPESDLDRQPVRLSHAQLDAMADLVSPAVRASSRRNAETDHADEQGD